MFSLDIPLSQRFSCRCSRGAVPTATAGLPALTGAPLVSQCVKVSRCPPLSRGHGFRPWRPCARWPTAVKVLYYSVAGSRAGLSTSAPTFGAIGWLSDTATGRLALGVILPTFAPVGGLGVLMLRTNRRRLARLARLRGRWPWPRPWLAWWPLYRPRLAPCARPCALQPWRGLRPWIRVFARQ